MGMDLSEPLTWNQWLHRLVSSRSIGITLLLLIAVVSELRFDWVEQVVGAYLTTTNSARPESGTIWEKGHRSVTARETLEELVADRLATQREAQTAERFTQILQLLSASEESVISADHFRRLYLELTADVAADILSPFAMVSLLNGDEWERAVFRRSGAGVAVYFLNSANGVLRQLALPDALLERIERSEQGMTKRLEDVPSFSDRIYAADRFFAALEALPEDVRRNIIPWPERLLEAGGRITRVAIADEIRDGRIDIGIEISHPEHHEILAMEGKDWAIWRLGEVLGSERRLPAAGPEPKEPPIDGETGDP
jgi:hypothetical protein